MTRLRRYLGERHRLLLWTLLVGGGGAVVIQRFDMQGAVARFDPQLATSATRPVQIGAVVAAWLLGVLVIRRRERRAWQRLLANTPFEAQNDQGRRPHFQQERKRKTITVEPISRGLLRQDGVRVEAIVDGVTNPIDVSITYVGSGGEDSGIKTGNDALDDQFVFEVEAGSNLRDLFDPEVQSSLMDISVPGTLRIEQTRVRYEVPFTRLRPDELGTVARAVVTIAARMQRLNTKGAL